MSAEQEPRRSILPAVVLATALLPAFVGWIADWQSEDIGQIAWELAHGMPYWRRGFSAGWRGQAEKYAEREGES